jgi:hypothetical protein
LGKILALMLVLVFATSLVTLQPTNAKSTVLQTDTMYAIPDENATIILLKGDSYQDTTNFYPAHNTSDGYVPSSWLFALFSTGNGSDGLTISAHDCNVTINSYNAYREDMGGYYLRLKNWLNYTITGTGTQRIDCTSLHSNFTVYIDGTARQQGNGWDDANFGIAVTGASSKVSIYSENTYHLFPRNAPHFTIFDYLINVLIVLAVILPLTIMLLLYRRHRKTPKPIQNSASQ